MNINLKTIFLKISFYLYFWLKIGFSSVSKEIGITGASLRFQMNSKREASHSLRGMLGYLKSKKFCGYIYKVNVSSKKGKGEQGLQETKSYCVL